MVLVINLRNPNQGRKLQGVQSFILCGTMRYQSHWKLVVGYTCSHFVPIGLDSVAAIGATIAYYSTGTIMYCIFIMIVIWIVYYDRNLDFMQLTGSAWGLGIFYWPLVERLKLVKLGRGDSLLGQGIGMLATMTTW